MIVATVLAIVMFLLILLYACTVTFHIVMDAAAAMKSKLQKKASEDRAMNHVRSSEAFRPGCFSRVQTWILNFALGVVHPVAKLKDQRQCVLRWNGIGQGAEIVENVSQQKSRTWRMLTAPLRSI